MKINTQTAIYLKLFNKLLSSKSTRPCPYLLSPQACFVTTSIAVTGRGAAACVCEMDIAICPGGCVNSYIQLPQRG